MAARPLASSAFAVAESHPRLVISFFALVTASARGSADAVSEGLPDVSGLETAEPDAVDAALLDAVGEGLADAWSALGS